MTNNPTDTLVALLSDAVGVSPTPDRSDYPGLAALFFNEWNNVILRYKGRVELSPSNPLGVYFALKSGEDRLVDNKSF